jgi:hypothetical protein
MKTTLVALAAFLCALAWADPGLPSELDTLRGEVLEAQHVDAYTYLRLRTAKGDVWAAVARVPVHPGSKVTIFGPAEMRDFESRGLGRTFDTIYFGVLGVEASGTGAPSGAGNQPVGAPVTPAEGPEARTVAQVVGGRLALQGRHVAVRARVDRVSRNVMGMNWVHLRDGTGTPAEGNYDVVATSRESPDVGEVVIARGIVRTDVQMGMGHAFKVLVENASFR